MSTDYLECVVSDRGFVNKPAQVSDIAPTLRAQDHGNQPKVIEVCGGGLTVEDNNTPGIEVIGMLENSGTTQQHNNRVHCVDDISPTLTAVSGGTHHIKIFDISRFRVRKLTPTEYGRLQAFPVDDGWEQVVSDSQAYKQFGNAVTTNVVEAIAINIRAFLDRRAAATAPEAVNNDVTDLSDAPQKIKDEIIKNDELLKAREDKPEKPKTTGLEFFSNEELLAELNRRMTSNV